MGRLDLYSHPSVPFTKSDVSLHLPVLMEASVPSFTTFVSSLQGVLHHAHRRPIVGPRVDATHTLPTIPPYVPLDVQVIQTAHDQMSGDVKVRLWDALQDEQKEMSPAQRQYIVDMLGVLGSRGNIAAIYSAPAPDRVVEDPQTGVPLRSWPTPTWPGFVAAVLRLLGATTSKISMDLDNTRQDQQEPVTQYSTRFSKQIDQFNLIVGMDYRVVGGIRPYDRQQAAGKFRDGLLPYLRRALPDEYVPITTQEVLFRVVNREQNLVEERARRLLDGTVTEVELGQGDYAQLPPLDRALVLRVNQLRTAPTISLGKHGLPRKPRVAAVVAQVAAVDAKQQGKQKQQGKGDGKQGDSKRGDGKRNRQNRSPEAEGDQPKQSKARNIPIDSPGEQKSAGRLEYRCFNCNASGHLIAACPQEPNSERIKKNRDAFRRVRPFRPRPVSDSRPGMSPAEPVTASPSTSSLDSSPFPSYPATIGTKQRVQSILSTVNSIQAVHPDQIQVPELSITVHFERSEHPFRAIVDSGAVISAISPAVEAYLIAHEIPDVAATERQMVYGTSTDLFQSANQSALTVLGTHTLFFDVGRWRLEKAHKFHVVANLSSEVLLGHDLLTKYKLNIMYNKSEIWLNGYADRAIPFHTIEEQDRGRQRQYEVTREHHQTIQQVYIVAGVPMPEEPRTAVQQVRYSAGSRTSTPESYASPSWRNQPPTTSTLALRSQPLSATPQLPASAPSSSSSSPSQPGKVSYRDSLQAEAEAKGYVTPGPSFGMDPFTQKTTQHSTYAYQSLASHGGPQPNLDITTAAYVPSREKLLESLQNLQRQLSQMDRDRQYEASRGEGSHRHSRSRSRDRSDTRQSGHGHRVQGSGSRGMQIEVDNGSDLESEFEGSKSPKRANSAQPRSDSSPKPAPSKPSTSKEPVPRRPLTVVTKSQKSAYETIQADLVVIGAQLAEYSKLAAIQKERDEKRQQLDRMQQQSGSDKPKARPKRTRSRHGRKGDKKPKSDAPPQIPVPQSTSMEVQQPSLSSVIVEGPGLEQAPVQEQPPAQEQAPVLEREPEVQAKSAEREAEPAEEGVASQSDRESGSESDASVEPESYRRRSKRQRGRREAGRQ